MSDETRITPALTADEWRRFRAGDHEIEGLVTVTATGALEIGGRKHALIAIANDCLPANDRRKITREWVDNLRVVADALVLIAQDETSHIPHAIGRIFAADRIRKYADTLASYLPPEP